MPTVIAHPFVALGLAPWLRRRGMTLRLGALGALCAVVPDADALGYWLGVPYGSTFGHRGFSHSIVFAVLLAALLARFRRRFAPAASATLVFSFLFACTLSHALLDAATDGGLGVALLSPFSNERYFLPWRPIPVSPLSLARFASGRGLSVLAGELCWLILPALAFATAGWWATRKRAGR